jgi:hypothetical protein
MTPPLRRNLKRRAQAVFIARISTQLTATENYRHPNARIV